MPGNFITMGVCLLQPMSKGAVHLTSANPKRNPSVDPQYLSKELDVEVFARHLQYLQTLVKTQPLASFLKPDGKRSSPDIDLQDLDAVKEFVRTTAISNWHPVGTCAMLPKEKRGVVSERLVVHGTKNVRVVDASIFPIITRGNPINSVYAVAAKAADLIKADN
jgi:choline dehydrogenase-like flavoprotein